MTKVWLAMLLLLAQTAWAVSWRLDDTYSPKSRVEPLSVTDESGRPLAQSFGARTAHVQFGAVSYRLATANWVGKEARIYYVIPYISGLRAQDGLSVTWQSNTGFAAGSAYPGQRVLVWSGRVRDSFMDQTLQLSMQVVLEKLLPSKQPALGFESWFEIETL